jgi:DNA-binding NarL/FixJ family response regulator
VDNETRPVRLIVADDHAMLRSGIRSMLHGEPGLEVVGEAADGAEALELCRRLEPDLVLMDVRMPKMDGLAATRAIKKEFPKTSVVMVTMQEDPDYLFEAVLAGAAGYVLKGATPEQLTDAVRQVLGGEFLFDQRLTIDLLRSMAGREKPAAPPSGAESLAEEPLAEPLTEPLTARETEILRLLAQGQTNPQIARELVASPGTVKNHVRDIIAKLGVSDRTQAAVRAMELDLLARG